MVKVSISLPNNAQITFESEEAEILRDVVGLVLKDLPRDLMQAGAGDTSQRRLLLDPEVKTEVKTEVMPEVMPEATTKEPEQKSNGVESIAEPETVDTVAPAPAAPRPALPRARRTPASRTPATEVPTATPAPQTNGNGGGPGFQPQDQSAEDTAAFVSFCQDSNPMGDMRRVVAAAEGAHRFFRVEGVDADELGLLFDLAGWRRPGNFTQTLRNAARSKFGWLERIPGRSGRYATTELGRSKISGD